MKKIYTVVVERDPETQWLVGEVVGLPGCHTEAKDLKSLQKNMQEAIQVYLETVQEQDDEVPSYVGTMLVEVTA